MDAQAGRHKVATAQRHSDGSISGCTPTALGEGLVDAPLPECTQIAAVMRWMDQFLASTPGVSEHTGGACMQPDEVVRLLDSTLAATIRRTLAQS